MEIAIAWMVGFACGFISFWVGLRLLDGPKVKKPIVTPTPGSVWTFKNDSLHYPVTVRVMGVIDGRIVNYKMLPEGGLFQNEHMELGSFLYCYEPKP